LNNLPLVSILITAYNSEKYIRKTIESIKKQSYKNWQLTVINDCSTDSTSSILKKYTSDKIKIINLKRNIGPYLALSKNFKFCRGKYIAFLDSDDLMHSKRLYSQVAELEKNKSIGLVASWFRIIDYKGRVIKLKKFPSTENEFNNIFPCQNLICNSSVMFRKKLINKLGFYNKFFFYSNDYHFYLRLFSKYKIKIIEKFYTDYRIHSEQRTKSNKIKKIIFKENLANLKWAKRNNLINKYNKILYLKNYFKNYLKFLLT
jgi:glycosyltransferase involved in cell wall biosynthesis